MRRGTRKRFNRGGGVRGNSIAPGHRSVMGSNSSARGRAARCYCRNLSWK